MRKPLVRSPEGWKSSVSAPAAWKIRIGEPDSSFTSSGRLAPTRYRPDGTRRKSRRCLNSAKPPDRFLAVTTLPLITSPPILGPRRRRNPGHLVRLDKDLGGLFEIWIRSPAAEINVVADADHGVVPYSRRHAKNRRRRRLAPFPKCRSASRRLSNPSTYAKPAVACISAVIFICPAFMTINTGSRRIAGRFGCRVAQPGVAESIAPKNCATARPRKAPRTALSRTAISRRRAIIHPAKAYWLMTALHWKATSYGPATASLNTTSTSPSC